MVAAPIMARGLWLGQDPNDVTGGGPGSTITVQGNISSGYGMVVVQSDNNYVGNWVVPCDLRRERDAGGQYGSALGATANTTTINANAVLASNTAFLVSTSRSRVGRWLRSRRSHLCGQHNADCAIHDRPLTRLPEAI